MLGRERGAIPEIGLHRALAVRRNQNVAACGRRSTFRGLEPHIHAERLHVVDEDAAELIVEHAPDVRGAAAEIGDPCDGVRHRATGHLRGRPHLPVKLLGALLIDEHHGAPGYADAREELIVDMREHVNDSIADSEDLY